MFNDRSGFLWLPADALIFAIVFSTYSDRPTGGSVSDNAANVFSFTLKLAIKVKHAEIVVSSNQHLINIHNI